jgi:hypothetical protein
MDGKVVDQPTLEVSIRILGEEAASIAFFPIDEGGWTVLVGVRDQDERETLTECLKLAITSLQSADLKTFDPTLSSADIAAELVFRSLGLDTDIPPNQR